MKCKYGCNLEAKYTLKNGTKCCSKWWTQCPVNRKLNSDGLKGKPRVSWNKGKTKYDCDGLRRSSEKNKLNHKNGILKCYLPSFKGKTHTKETKNKIAIALKGNNHSNGRGIITEYKGIKFRSTWEAKTAEYLDSKNINWKYEEKEYSISETTSYRPDFFIYDEHDNLLKIIEVKGYHWKHNMNKYEMFKKIYPNILIELWEEQELRDLGIL